MQKKLDWPKNRLLVKNPQFLSSQVDIQATLPTHELITFRQVFYGLAKNYESFSNREILSQSNFFCISL